MIAFNIQAPTKDFQYTQQLPFSQDCAASGKINCKTHSPVDRLSGRSPHTGCESFAQKGKKGFWWLAMLIFLCRREGWLPLFGNDIIATSREAAECRPEITRELLVLLQWNLLLIQKWEKVQRRALYKMMLAKIWVNIDTHLWGLELTTLMPIRRSLGCNKTYKAPSRFQDISPGCDSH